MAEVQADARANREFAELRLPPPVSPDPEGGRRAPSGNNPPKPDEPGPPPEDTPADPPAPEAPPNEEAKLGAGAGSQPEGPGQGSEAPEGSPDQRLDRMLDSVRKAQDAKTGGGVPSSSNATDRKDW